MGNMVSRTSRGREPANAAEAFAPPPPPIADAGAAPQVDRYEPRHALRPVAEGAGIGVVAAGGTAVLALVAGASAGTLLIPCGVVGSCAALIWAVYSYINSRSEADRQACLASKERLEQQIAVAGSQSLHDILKKVRNTRNDFVKAGLAEESQSLERLVLQTLVHRIEHLPGAVRETAPATAAPAPTTGGPAPELGAAMMVALQVYQDRKNNDNLARLQTAKDGVRFGVATASAATLRAWVNTLAGAEARFRTVKLSSMWHSALVLALSTLCHRLQETGADVQPDADEEEGIKI